MKPSFLIGIAITIGAFVAFFAAHFASMNQGSNPNGPHVVIASNTIQAGTAITESKLQTLAWPSSITPTGVFSNAKKIDGRIARQTIEAGELILESKLAAPNSQAGLAAIITEGKRAISVRVNDVVGVAGFALPGNYVDVLVSAKDASGHPFSKVVLNRVKVLAIAQETNVDANKPKVVNAVTLELTPTESEQLDLARSIGTLSLVLRNEMDKTASSSTGARLNDLTQVPAIQELSSNLTEDQSAPAKPKQNPAPKKAKIITSTEVNNRVEEIRGIKESEDAK